MESSPLTGLGLRHIGVGGSKKAGASVEGSSAGCSFTNLGRLIFALGGLLSWLQIAQITLR